MTPSTDTPAVVSGGSAGAPRSHLPDFFIVGHPKCGTTALYLMLRRHPQIYMPELKEPQFFAPEMRADEQRARALPSTLEDYLELFSAAAPEQRAGEASPSYLRSRTAAAEIAKLRPDARIIALLREPASFLRSVHLQFVQMMIEPEHDLRKALALEDARRQGRHLPRPAHWTPTLMYSEHVRYVEQLQRYQQAFSDEQLLVVIYDDFRTDNEGTARRIMRFLEVDDTVPIAPIEANPSVRVRAERLHRVKRAVHASRGPAARTARAVNALIPQSVRSGALRPIRRQLRRRILWTEPAPADESLMLELRRCYEGEVIALSEHLGRDLVALWGYDALD
jgi:Sulfotransferase family